MSEMSPLVAEIDNAFANNPASKPLIVGESSLSYGEAGEQVRRLGGWFRELGFEPGDRVMVISGNDNAVAVMVFALVRCGIAAALVNPEAPADEILNLCRASEAAGAILDSAIDESAKVAETMGFPVLRIEDAGKRSGGLMGRLLRRKEDPSDDVATFPGALREYPEMETAPGDVSADQTAMILFTSGTTSRPKGVELTHRNISAQCAVFRSQYEYDPDSRILNVLPFHHTDGLNQGPFVALLAGATVFRRMKFSVQRLGELLDSIYADRITHFVTVPTVLALILRLGEDHEDCFKTTDFKYVLSTAAYLDDGIWTAIEDRFGATVVNSYGLTETVSEALYCGPDETTRRLGTIGKPVGCEARIVAADGNPVARGEVGELAICGDIVMKGYFGQPEETAAVLRDGWFLTGDLARLDEDGFYSIVGRKKNVIISGGINVYPEDVTSVLMEKDGVLDAVTFGLENELWGEVAVSCVVPDGKTDITLDQLTEHCRSRMSPESVPSRIYFMDEFPRGPAGKAVIGDVKERVLTLENAASTEGGSVFEQIRSIAAACFNTAPENLSPQSAPESTEGWDSLAHVNFIVAIEDSFGVKFSPRQIMMLETLQHAENFAVELLDGKNGA